MTYAVSKNVRSGCVCALHKDKICCASSRTRRVMGVWMNGGSHTILIPNTGEVVRIALPEGLCIQGGCFVRITP